MGYHIKRKPVPCNFISCSEKYWFKTMLFVQNPHCLHIIFYDFVKSCVITSYIFFSLVLCEEGVLFHLLDQTLRAEEQHTFLGMKFPLSVLQSNLRLTDPHQLVRQFLFPAHLLAESLLIRSLLRASTFSLVSHHII